MTNLENHFKKDNILEKAKNSFTNLINYNDKFKNSVQYPGEPLDNMKIKQLLLPVYDKIYEIKEDLLLFSELNSKNTSDKISPKKFNEMQHLHTNLLYNKNIIDETLNYMKEKIENVNYEQINKEFEEIELTLENLKQDMEDMVEQFNNKYEKIIKEKKRQKIADDLLKRKYPINNKYEGLNIGLKNKLDDDNENGIDYNKYKFDMDEINLEKENLMLKYLEDKQKAINDLPKLVPPYQKVNFNYDDIKAPNYKNLGNNKNKINNYNDNGNELINNINTNSNNINTNNNNIDTNSNNLENNNIGKNDDNDINEINFNNNNNYNNNLNEFNNNNKINNNISNNYNNNIDLNPDTNNINVPNQIYNNNNNNNNIINPNTNSNFIDNSKSKNMNIPKNYYMNADYNNEENEEEKNNNVDPTETLNNFKEKMSQASKAILTGPTPHKKSETKSKKSIDPSKKAYDAYMRNIQPRSNGSKITYQNFAKPKRPKPKTIKNDFKKKPYKYNTGKYPDENEKNRINDFIEKNPSRPINKNIKIFEKENLEEEIKQIVDINIKKALNVHQLNKNNIDSSQNRRNVGEDNNELIKILIQKFNDIENAIRETKNNNNGIEYNKDINEILANEIFNKIYSQMNLKIKNIQNKNEEPEEEEEEEEEKEEKENIIQPKKEDNNININIPEPKKINIFDENIDNSINFLDKAIPPPKDLNLNKYNDISLTSEALTESLNKKPDINNIMGINNQIEIKNINIKRNKFLYQDNNNEINYNKNNIRNENSLSEGEERSEPQESSDIDINKNNKYNTMNDFMPNFYGNKNRNGNDLLLLKNYNENLPNIDLDNNNINFNNNINKNEEYDLNNNNNMMKKFGLDKSSEYNSFKKNFLINMNNDKTITNFESMNNPHNQNNLYDELQNLKILKHNQKDLDDINHKIELLKLKNKQNNMDYDDNNIKTNNHYNNINNNIEKSDEGNSSPGEVRDDDSY